jgi:hypothetical protein
MAKTKEARWAELHDEAMRQFGDVQYALQAERQQCLDDRRFYSIAGAQWEGPLFTAFENRPRLEVNKVHGAVTRVVSDYRQNRITVDYVAKDKAKDGSLADVCDGLYRADEQDSVAEEAYDNAFEEAVSGGFGAWRLRAEYEDEYDDENEKQRIRIEPIYDADTSVFFDLDAKRYDKSDARFCFVVKSMTPEAFSSRYPDASPVPVAKLTTRVQFDWATPDVIYVAEWFRVEETSELVRTFRLLDGSTQRYTAADFAEDENLERMLSSTGAVEIGQKRAKRRRVRKLVVSGAEVLEDQGYIPGGVIPIVPMYGKRWFVDNIERCMGVVRLAKDPQRIANMQRSRLAEVAALSPIEKPILTPEQIDGFEELWANDNLTNNAYLLLNPITNADGTTQPAGPVGYTKPPQVAPAMAALIQLSDTDMRDVLGNPEGADKLVPNTSAQAVDMVSQRVDNQSFVYVSNFAKSMRRCGEIWLAMAREVYVEEGREMKIVGEQNEVSTVELQRPTMGPGGFELENDLSRARFDVTASVGPATTSKRQATRRELLQLAAITKDPQTASIIEQQLMMNLDGEGMGDVRDFFRKKLVQAGVLKPTDEEAKELAAAAAQQQPDPQALYLQAAAAEAQARAMKAQADTALAVAKSEETKANTVKTLASVNISAQSQAIKTAEAIARATTVRPPTPASGQPMPE